MASAVRSPLRRPFLLVLTLVVLVGAVACARFRGRGAPKSLASTVADLEVVHPLVTVAGAEVRGARRLVDGEPVETSDEGLARVRSDDGTVILLDRRTRASLRPGGSRLEGGRIFVQGAVGALHEIAVGEVVALVKGADVGLQRAGDGGRIYCSREEIVVRDVVGEHRVRSGESAVVTGGKVTVEPEKVFDDWTSGMAAPWAARGEPRRALGELWGIGDDSGPGSAGSPLAIRAHDVTATVLGEVARTTVKTTFFNGGSAPVAGDFRLALPEGALVSRFAFALGSEPLTETTLAIGREPSSERFPSVAALEWAGDGWVRGRLPSIRSGGTVTVLVQYTEWLHPERRGTTEVVEYRYPLTGTGEPPLVGEFSARVDASGAGALSVAAGVGAKVQGRTVVVRRSDFRPTADLVVELALPRWDEPARLYVAPAEGDLVGDTVWLRTELPAAPADQGVTLALVVDTSASVDAALLGTARAVVAAILGGLGPRDRAVVLAADQTARPLGPERIGPVDGARREAVLAALDRLAPGGATDLGRALEAGADALPEDAPGGMVVYVGDGWPTLGDPGLADVEARLARRPSGAPRLAAVAVGPLANRPLLAALTRSAGPLLEVADASEAAAAAVRLLVEALRPTYAGVEVELEPFVERIYPRAARAVRAGDTLSVVARVPAGRRPERLTLRWRASDGAHEEVRRVVELTPAVADDLRRRWAKARYDDVILTGKGKEAAIDVAARSGLLTPWTAFVATGSGYQASRVATRILDLSSVVGVAYAAPLTGAGTLDGGHDEAADLLRDDPRLLEEAAAAAARRVIDAARVAMRACRDARAALRPDLEGALRVELAIDGQGRVKRTKVAPLSRTIDDAALTRCLEAVLGGLDYPACGVIGEIRVEHQITFPVAIVRQPRKCSELSRVPMPLRRGVWREQVGGDAAEAYVVAKSRCELRTWTDQRALLELVLDAKPDGLERLRVADQLALAGEDDAAEFLRREAVRRARDPGELRALRRHLLGLEEYPIGTFEKQYAAATGPEGRLAVVRRFLEVAPHDPRLRRRLLALLAAAGDGTALLTEVRRVRDDPFAEAALLADAAEALKRAGDAAEARRAFGELVERAPTDPWARAFLVDRLRNVGWFEDATAAGESLEQLAPDEPAATLRLALAHEGAGRTDIAARMLLRLTQTGGRTGDAAFGALATELSAVLLARAHAAARAPEEQRLLRAALLELALDEHGAVLLVRSPAASVPVGARLVPPAGSERATRMATTLAAGLGLHTLEFDPVADRGAKLLLTRRQGAEPEPPTPVRVHALLPGKAGELPRVLTVDAELPVTGKDVELRWDGAALVR